MAKNKNNKDDRALLGEISGKLDTIITLLSLVQAEDKDERIKILKNYEGPLSKRELERFSGIDRHEF